MKLEEFNPELLDLSSTVVLFGKRNSGKTYWICDLMYSLYKNGGKNGQKVDLCCVFSQTEELQSNFQKFIPPCFIHNAYSESKLLALLETQKNLTQKNGRTSNVVVILDDCSFSKEIFNTTMSRIYSNGRHYRLMFILSLQYSMQLPASMRGNIDVAVAFKEPIHANKRRLYESVFGMFDSLKQFDKIFSEVTQNYGCMVAVNNGSSSTDINKNIFWSKARSSLPSHFPLGRPIYWKWAEQYANRQVVRNENGNDRKNSIVQVYRNSDTSSRHSQRSEINKIEKYKERSREKEREDDHSIARIAPPLSLLL